MHALRLQLITTSYEKIILEKRFRCMWHIHNVLVKHSMKQINKLHRDKVYMQVLGFYGRLTKTLNSTGNEKDDIDLKANIEDIQEHLKVILNDYIDKYRLTKTSIEVFATLQANRFSHMLSSQQVQKEADRVYTGIEKVLYKDGKNLHFKRLNDVTTIGAKSATNGTRYYDCNHTKYYPKKISPKYDAEIEFLGLQIKVKLNMNDPYIAESINGDISCCDIKRLMFRDGWHYYVILYVRNNIPVKDKQKVIDAKQGMDLGTSTVAVVSDDNAILKELAPDSKLYESKIGKIQKHISLSNRINNPDNYDANGKVKKGHHKWHVSKLCRRKKRLLTVLRRKKAAYMEQSHYELVREILSNGKFIYTEKMNFKSLHKRSKITARQEKESTIKTKNGEVKKIHKYKRKKRFGHSISNRAPSKFLAILTRKAAEYGGFVKFVNTAAFKASQYRHDTDSYEKIPLKQRMKIIDNQEVQRDLYSAFLLRNTNSNYSAPKHKQCRQNFPRFVEVTHNLIANMKADGISMPYCFGF